MDGIFSRAGYAVLMRRRDLLSLLPTAGLSIAANQSSRTIISSNTYPWMTFARRKGEKFVNHSDDLMAAIARTGLNGYEPIIDGIGDFEGLGARLKKHGLAMPSLYVNSTLHEKASIEKCSREVLEIGRKARGLGTTIIVTNPSPIKWGGKDDKSDQQLKLQARALDELGAALRKENLILAYHNHDIELRQGAREFHHMLTATSPENVRFCLDSHWIYRGCGNSEVALFDSLERYGDRIEELHLRQSTRGVWNEVFRLQGDINYEKVLEELDRVKVHPHLVLEQAVEEQSPSKLGAEKAHRKGALALANYRRD